MFNPIRIASLAHDPGIIQSVRDRLVQQKDPAAEKLAGVLNELAKGVGALDDEIVRYVSLSFNDETVVSGYSVQVRDTRVQLT